MARRIDWRELAPIAGLVLVVVAVLGPALGGGFVNWDDDRFLVHNPWFHGPLTAYLAHAFGAIQFEAYQPLHLAAYAPDRLLWPAWAPGFHLLNAALFAGAVVLLYRLARRHAAAGWAFAAAAAFAVHPLCVEPAAWITGRKDVLALALFVAALALEERRAGARPALLGLALIAAALLTKTAALVFAPVLALWLVWLRGQPWRAALGRAAPYALLGLVAGLGTALLWREHHLIASGRPLALPVDVAATVGFYLGKLVVPLGLGAMYPERAPGALFLAALVATLALAAALGWRRLAGPARFAVLAPLVALAPVSNAIPIGFRYADRYALFALAVLVVPLARGLATVAARLGGPRRVAAVVAAIALAWAGLGERQAATWRSSEALWRRAVAVSPTAYLARLKLGETLRDAGESRDAVAAYQGAIQLDRGNLLGYAGLLDTYADEAERSGALPAGTAARWLAALGPALADRAALWRLLDELAAGPCPRCGATLALIAVRWLPDGDDAWLARAEAALSAGRPAIALVFLEGVRARDGTAAQAIATRARAALGAP